MMKMQIKLWKYWNSGNTENQLVRKEKANVQVMILDTEILLLITEFRVKKETQNTKDSCFLCTFNVQ